MGTQLPLPKGAQPPPIVGLYMSWSNGRIDQDATASTQEILCEMRTQLPSQKGGKAPLIFGHCLLWPDWMDQDAAWYGGRPHCYGWSPIAPFPKKRPSPLQCSAHVYCGQTAGWIKTPLGMEVGLGAGHIVLDGDPAPPKKRSTATDFSTHVYCGQTAG